MRMPWQRETSEPTDEAVSTFAPIDDIDALNAVLAGGTDAGPSVLLIHDPWCPISDRAYREASRVGDAIHLVVTDGGRELTRHI